MRFMMLMIPRVYQPGVPQMDPPPAEVFEAMMKYNDELKAAGAMLSGEGLHPLTDGARISFEGGRPTATDGPFVEAKEVLGGFWILDVASKDEAIEWAKKVPAMDGDVIEIRQIHEMSDFPEEIQQIVAAHS